MLQGRPSVIFDLDGTLADTSADLLAAANACFRAMGAGEPLGPGDALVAFHGGKAMLRAGFARLGREEDEAGIDRWYLRLLEAYDGALSVHTRLYPGAAKALGRLQGAGYALAVCTNKPAGLADRLLRELGLRDLFVALVGGDTLAVRKPDPAPLRLAIEQAGGAPSCSMILGDTASDLGAGRAAGVPVALVTFGPEGRAIGRLGPEAMLDSFDDLPAVARRLVGEPRGAARRTAGRT